MANPPHALPVKSTADLKIIRCIHGDLFPISRGGYLVVDTTQRDLVNIGFDMVTHKNMSAQRPQTHAERHHSRESGHAD